MDSELQSKIYRLAGQAALLTVSQREHPAIVERLTDFMQDRGAVGLLLRDYVSGQSIEKVALSFWNSRLEKSGSRFEDLVTSNLLAVFSAIVAGVIVEMWKGEFGPLKRLFGDHGKERLKDFLHKEPHFTDDLNSLLPYYYAKVAGKGVTDIDVAYDLFSAVRQGETFSAFAEKLKDTLDYPLAENILLFAREAARGIVDTELQRLKLPLPAAKLITAKIGLPISPIFVFGETISLFDADDLGLGPNWPNLLRKKRETPQLRPELLPRGTNFGHRMPKILILSERILDRLRNAGHGFEGFDGVVSMDSYMTNHISVMARSYGIGGIACQLSEDERATATFAVISGNRLQLHFGALNITNIEFDALMAQTRPKPHPGD